ncbi:hypothetical protein GGR56DRAFT_140077 [Xylariaceae sp. FL0804]|nr:hypothetical protein GGR56DRAFT_140077 [Xylariaceae sp. FL0804]
MRLKTTTGWHARQTAAAMLVLATSHRIAVGMVARECHDMHSYQFYSHQSQPSRADRCSLMHDDPIAFAACRNTETPARALASVPVRWGRLRLSLKFCDVIPREELTRQREPRRLARMVTRRRKAGTEHGTTVLLLSC